MQYGRLLCKRYSRVTHSWKAMFKWTRRQCICGCDAARTKSVTESFDVDFDDELACLDLKNGLQTRRSTCIMLVLPRCVAPSVQGVGSLTLVLYNIPRLSKGVLFICFFVDYRILYQDLTEDTVKDGFQFYATFFNAPPAIKVGPLRNLASQLNCLRHFYMASLELG